MNNDYDSFKSQFLFFFVLLTEIYIRTWRHERKKGNVFLQLLRKRQFVSFLACSNFVSIIINLLVFLVTITTSIVYARYFWSKRTAMPLENPTIWRKYLVYCEESAYLNSINSKLGHTLLHIIYMYTHTYTTYGYNIFIHLLDESVTVVDWTWMWKCRWAIESV